MEVWLANPLSVPLRLDHVALHAHLLPDPSPPPGSQPASDEQHSKEGQKGNTAAVDDRHSQQGAPQLLTLDAQMVPSKEGGQPGSGERQGEQGTWQPHTLTAGSQHGPEEQHGRQGTWQPHTLTGPLALPPGGKPVKLLLRGRPLVAGRLQLLGVHVTAWGVTWLQVWAIQGGGWYGCRIGLLKG